ncbi:hypothetical protein K501DRAFT_337550 [Backusella circina FSU 941]|nr:hypothetical protein K501DRAFT_337550 [Backusella circina FSU 941]
MHCILESQKTKKPLSEKNTNGWMPVKSVFVKSRFTHQCRRCVSTKGGKADWECSSCHLRFHQRCIPHNDDPTSTDAENNTCGWCLKRANNSIEMILTHKRKKHLVKWKELSYLRCDWIPSSWFTTHKEKAYSNYRENFPKVPPSGESIIQSNITISKILDIKKCADPLRITTRNVRMFRAIYKGSKNRAYWEVPPSTTDPRYPSFQKALDDYKEQYLVQACKKKELI